MAGLTAAYALLRPYKDFGWDHEEQPPRIVILESEARPGGLAVSLSREGVVTDLGPHRLHTELPEVKALLAEVAEERLIEVRRESHLYWRGQRLEYPINPLELLRKIGPVAMGKLGLSAVASKVLPAGSGPDSFERVMKGKFGPGLWDAMLGPYSTKVWKMPPGQIHGDVARVRVSAGGLGSLAKRLITFGDEKAGAETALKSFRYPKGGLQTLVDILVEKACTTSGNGAQLRCSTPVESLELAKTERGWRIEHIIAGGEAYTSPGAVVSTIPLPTLARLLEAGGMGAETPREAGSLEYLSMLLVVLVIGRDRLTRDNWLYFFDDNFVINRAYEAKNFDPSMAPEGRTVLCCEVTCRHGDELWNGDHDALRARVAREVAATGLFAESEVVGGFVHPIRWAYPIYSLDYRERLKTIFGKLARVENLISCGRQGLFNHNNTDHSMSMGLDAARVCAEHAASPSAAWFEGVLERFGHFRIVD